MELVRDWLRQRGWGEISHSESVAGGCISAASRLTLDSGRRLFLKLHSNPPPGMFRSEAAGLRALAAAAPPGLRVPAVLHAADRFLLLEDLGCGSPGRHYWQQLGLGLAELHAQPQADFGFDGDNYCGATAQRNPPCANGHEFFARYRLLELSGRCAERGLLDRHDETALHTIAERLQEWIPAQGPALLHGDLWSGNVHCCANGEPALIDPAAYRGWPEADLAMTLLFGGFDAEFYAVYEEHSGISSDWRQRAELYNLYHLLNHLLLFGGSYLSSIRQICRRYAS